MSRAGGRVQPWRKLAGPACALASVLAVLPACHDDAPSGGEPAPAASGAPDRAVATPPPSASTRHPPPPPPLCRAISVAGALKLSFLSSGTPAPDAGPSPTLIESGEIPDEAWVTFDASGKLTAKHPRSTREVAFVGPAKVRPCVAHAEEAWVEHGKLVSEPGAGERPGGEEWVITPAGVIRYGGGRLELTVTAATATAGAKVDVKVSSGTAFAWTGDEAGPVKPAPAPAASSSSGGASTNDGWIQLTGPRTVTLSVKKAATAEALAGAAVERCKVEAKLAKDLAAAVGAPDAALAQLAPRHVVARHLARAACSVASLRAGLLEPSAARDGFLTALRDAEADWKSFRPRGLRGRPH